MEKKIFERLFDSEQIVDCLDDLVYAMNIADIPVDDNGFMKGIFKITLTWEKE
jgi:hypothetical protein